MSRFLLVGSLMADVVSLAGAAGRALETSTLVLTVLVGSVCLLPATWAVAEGLFAHLTQPSDPLVEAVPVNPRSQRDPG